MSLPTAWVDRIFDRLTVRYGVQFLNRWKGVDIDSVRFDWAAVLAGFENWPEAISFAIDNLDDERPPTAAMFRALALKAPKPERLALPEPKPDPDRMAAELQKLRSFLPGIRANNVGHDFKAWAQNLKVRHEAGEKLNQNQIRCYTEALGMTLEAA